MKEGSDGGTNFILRIKEQETHLNLHEHDDDYGGNKLNSNTCCIISDFLKMVIIA